MVLPLIEIFLVTQEASIELLPIFNSKFARVTRTPQSKTIFKNINLRDQIQIDIIVSVDEPDNWYLEIYYDWSFDDRVCLVSKEYSGPCVNDSGEKNSKLFI